jgi:hypothetical protein
MIGALLGVDNDSTFPISSRSPLRTEICRGPSGRCVNNDAAGDNCGVLHGILTSFAVRARRIDHAMTVFDVKTVSRQNLAPNACRIGNSGHCPAFHRCRHNGVLPFEVERLNPDLEQSQ